jgi:hypothetical protein
MPYIKAEDRQALDKYPLSIENAGELNYMLTKVILNYWKNYKGQNYQKINDIVGALECAKLEFVRRVVNNYEDEKIKSNGDVY